MTKVAIMGATGYGGIEFLRILLTHPEAKVTYVAGHRTVGQKISDVYPNLRGLCDLPIQEPNLEQAGNEADFCAFALEPGVGTPIIRQALKGGKKVLDFSAEFRLKNLNYYEQFYGEHAAPELVEQAAYGIPELHRQEITNANLVAVPGCHASAGIFSLAPLAKYGLIDLQSISIDSKTGISGAGRTRSNLLNHYPEADENVVPYAIPDHRHRPEIEQELSLLADEEIKVTFVPSRVPMVRGILATSFADMAVSQGQGKGAALATSTSGELVECYQDFYANEHFVRIGGVGQFPQTKQTSGSNFVDIGVAYDARTQRAIALCALDNLGKGLAGAAVQCFNLMNGYEETLGLKFAGVWP